MGGRRTLTSCCHSRGMTGPIAALRDLRPVAVAIFLACGAPAGAMTQAGDDDYQRNVFASHTAGAWRADAALFGSTYTYGPQYECRMRTAGATLTQARPNESGTLQAHWDIAGDIMRLHDDVALESVKIGRERFELRRLPWRLAAPSEDGIVLSFDRSMLAVRRSAEREWLPFEYLTASMFEARSFEISFHYRERDTDRVVRQRRVVDLDGFREVARWCGRQLLRDRAHQDRVRDLLQ